MTSPDFVYTTYIRSTPEKIWTAITNPEFARQYWGGLENRSDWKKGSKWAHVDPAEPNDAYVVGEVIEYLPPKRLVLTWASPDDLSDGSRVTFEIEPVGDMVRLNVVHGDFKPGSIMQGKISMGWPRVLCSLKSFLETGKGFDIRAGKEGSCAKSEKQGAQGKAA